MAPKLSIDTSFLIDLHREHRRKARGPAHAFLETNPGIRLCICSIALGEFAEGFVHGNDPLVQMVRQTHEVLPIDEPTALVYAQIARKLRTTGRLIGTNDLWIAASAVRHGVAVVTADVAHFTRIDELQVRSYRS